MPTTTTASLASSALTSCAALSSLDAPSCACNRSISPPSRNLGDLPGGHADGCAVGATPPPGAAAARAECEADGAQPRSKAARVAQNKARQKLRKREAKRAEAKMQHESWSSNTAAEVADGARGVHPIPQARMPAAAQGGSAVSTADWGGSHLALLQAVGPHSSSHSTTPQLTMAPVDPPMAPVDPPMATSFRAPSHARGFPPADAIGASGQGRTKLLTCVQTVEWAASAAVAPICEPPSNDAVRSASGATAAHARGQAPADFPIAPTPSCLREPSSAGGPLMPPHWAPPLPLDSPPAALNRLAHCLSDMPEYPPPRFYGGGVVSDGPWSRELRATSALSPPFGPSALLSPAQSSGSSMANLAGVGGGARGAGGPPSVPVPTQATMPPLPPIDITGLMQHTPGFSLAPPPLVGQQRTTGAGAGAGAGAGVGLLATPHSSSAAQAGSQIDG